MLRIRDIKAYAKETLLGRYGTVIGAYFLSGLLRFLCLLLTALSLLLALGNTNRFSPFVREYIPSFRPVPALSVLCAVLFPFLLLFSVILSVWFGFGREKLILNLCRGNTYGVGDIFYGFRSGSHPWKVVALYIVRYLLIEVNLLLPLLTEWMATASGYRYLKGHTDFGNPWGIAIFVVSLLAALWMLWLELGFTFADTVLIDRPETDVIDALRESLHILKFRKLKLLGCVVSFILWGMLWSMIPVTGLWIGPFIEASMTIFYLSARGESGYIPAVRAAAAGTSEPEVSGPEPVPAEVQEPAVFPEETVHETLTQDFPMPAEEPAAEITESTEITENAEVSAASEPSSETEEEL